MSRVFKTPRGWLIRELTTSPFTGDRSTEFLLFPPNECENDRGEVISWPVWIHLGFL
jgi:hypothetical protein